MKNAILAVYCCTALAVHALERPLILKQFMDNNETSSHVTVVKNLTAEEKAFFWKNTVLSTNGVLLRTNFLDMQLTLNEQMYIDSNKSVNKSSELLKHISKKYDLNTIIGELQESENWINYFLQAPTGIAVLSIEDLVANDAKITLIADFFNTKVCNYDATLVLINGDKSLAKRVWVLGWTAGNIKFSLELPDEIQTSGSTKLTKTKVLNFAHKIICP